MATKFWLLHRIDLEMYFPSVVCLYFLINNFHGVYISSSLYTIKTYYAVYLKYKRGCLYYNIYLHIRTESEHRYFSELQYKLKSKKCINPDLSPTYIKCQIRKKIYKCLSQDIGSLVQKPGLLSNK